MAAWGRSVSPDAAQKSDMDKFKGISTNMLIEHLRKTAFTLKALDSPMKSLSNRRFIKSVSASKDSKPVDIPDLPDNTEGMTSEERRAVADKLANG